MNDLRSHVLKLFSEHLESKDAEKLEKSVYNFTIAKATKQRIERSWSNKFFKMFYKNKANSLNHNLKYGILVSAIKNKTHKMKHIPYLLSWELWPEMYEAHFQKKLTKEMIQLQDQANMQNTSGMFSCGKCKSECTTYFSLQTRSADEPMTNYITCMKCGHKWKD